MIEVTGLEKQSSGSFDKQRTHQKLHVCSNEEGLVESSGCTAMNGVLASTCVSIIRLGSGTDFENHPEPTRTHSSKRKLPEWVHSHGVVEGGLIERSSDGAMNGGPATTLASSVQMQVGLDSGPQAQPTRSRKRRHPKSIQVDEVLQSQKQACDEASTSDNEPRPAAAAAVTQTKLFFRLSKFRGGIEEYILEQNEVETGAVNKYHLSLYEAPGKWKVKKTRAPDEELDVDPVEGDSYPSIFYENYDVPLHSRLVEWILQLRPRAKGPTDKFYFNMGNQFRSIVEVGAYILYKSNKDLIPIRSMSPPEAARTVSSLEASEAVAIEAMMQLSSTQAGNDNPCDINVNGSPMETEIPALSVEINAQEKTVRAYQDLKGKGIMAIEVAGPSERTKIEPHEEAVKFGCCSTETEEDIFDGLPDIMNLNLLMADKAVESNSCTTEAKENIFSDLPDIVNLNMK